MKLRISSDLVESLHQDFAEIGTKVGANPQQRSCSTKRLGYRAAESSAHEYLRQHFSDVPTAKTIVDPVGNLFIEIPGTQEGLAPIVIGSHLDTVARPGNFDGVSGVVAAMSIARAVLEQKIKLRHPLRIVAWRCEESSRFCKAMIGSKWFAGQLPTADLLALTDQSGLCLADEMADLGLRPDLIEQRAASFDRRIAAYLELHIEQWNVLEQRRLPVGIVSGFKGTYRAKVHCYGSSIHTGTGIMQQRKDPTPAVGRMIAAVEDEVLRRNREDGDDLLVGSTGFVWSNGSMNQTAQEAGFTLDLRDMQEQRLVETFETLKSFFQEAAARNKVQLDIVGAELTKPVETSQYAREILVEASQALELDAPLLASGAGHDAVPLLMRGDKACMIFARSTTRVPNESYSHKWTEVADVGDIAIGAELGLEWLIRFDAKDA